MFREASVFVPEFIVLRWLRWSNGFVGVVEPDQSIVFYGLESCWRSGVVEPDQSIVFYGFQKSPAWGILSACFLLGMGSTHAGVRLFRNRSFVFYGFQRWREAFCLRVFCLAWARILLVFRSFRIWRWRDFERPSFGIHVSYGFLLGRGSTAAGVRVFRNRSFVFSYGFQRWREAFCLCVFCLAWARILLVFRSFRIWRWRDFEQPSFGIHVSNGFLLGRDSTAAGVRVFRNRSFVFYVKHSVCVFFAWHGLESCWCFGLLDSDADETLSSHRSESTAFGCSGTGPKFFLFSFFYIFSGLFFFI